MTMPNNVRISCRSAKGYLAGLDAISAVNDRLVDLTAAAATLGFSGLHHELSELRALLQKAGRCLYDVTEAVREVATQEEQK